MFSPNCRLVASLISVSAIAVFGSACDRNRSEAEADDAVSEQGAGRAVQRVEAALPTDVLVKINGKELTRLRAETDLHMRMDAVREQIPPERIPEARDQMYRTVVDQFIIRELLLAEADRRGIAVTEEDRSNTYARLAKTLPEGMTVEDAMRNSPMGEERMREEVEAGLVITRMLAQAVSNKVAVTNEDVAEFREKNRANLQLPERVRASHILIATGDDDSEAAKAEKRKEAEEIRASLADGADFGEKAAAFSACPSKQRGGDLGLFGRGQMVKEFEDAAFSQKIGEIGPVVDTKFGYHIIKVTQHDESGSISDEKIREMLQKQGQRDVTSALIERLKQQADIELAPELRELVPGVERE